MSQSEKRFSTKVGEEYDLFSLALPHQDEIQQRTVEILTQHFNQETSIKVLEIGFGTGITSKEILSKDNRIQLVALDNESVMYEKASEKLNSIPKERFHLEIIDVIDYLKKQPDSSFDAVISVWVLHNFLFSFRLEVLKEIYRVLKQRGIFVNGDKIAVSNNDLHKKHFDWQIEQFNIYDTINRPELKKEWIEHYIEDEKPERIMYEEKMTEDLEEIGFKEVKVSDRHYLDAIVCAIKYK